MKEEYVVLMALEKLAKAWDVLTPQQIQSTTPLELARHIAQHALEHARGQAE